jgi:hypothetical protein
MPAIEVTPLKLRMQMRGQLVTVMVYWVKQVHLQNEQVV